MNNSLRVTVITLLLAASSLSAATLYVSLGSTNPTPPYTNWATAAMSIQAAVNVAAANDAVLVTNGVYPGYVSVTTALTLLSVNGPQFTIINGGGTNRCVDLTEGASLTGFTLTNGYVQDGNGGGVECASKNAFLTNCLIVGNSATNDGGGAYGSTLYNCTLSGNEALNMGGGAYGATLYNCTLTGNSATFLNPFGGGACVCTLYNCTLSGNSAVWGGGASGSTLYNCTLTGNSAGNGVAPGSGGGASGSTLYNCTLSGNGAHGGGGALGCALYNCMLSGNSATWGGGASGSTLYNCTLSDNWAGGGGGAYSCTLDNCTLSGNSALAGGVNYDASSTLNYCCTTPLPTTGVGNITNAPLFVDSANGNLRLQSNSPCINAGNNAYVTTTTDLDGRRRIVGGRVDMGAYEFQPGISGVFIGWLQQYGLPTDGSADYADPDHDGMNNWQEWVCGTNPTNALSVLRIVSALPTSTNATVTWQSVAGVNYLLERSANLASPFTLLATNIVGQAGTTSYADTNATGAGPFFYRVGVKSP
jgi:hypothetical protein